MDLQQIKTQPFHVKLATVLFSLVTLCYITIVAKEILSPLIFSCLFSILLLPFASFLERKIKLPRSAASMISILSLLGCIALILYIVGSQLSDLGNDWPQFQQQLLKTLDNVRDWVAATFHVNANKQLNYVNSATSKMMASGTTVIGATLLSLSSLLLFFVFTFIYTFFFLLYRKLIMKFLLSVFLDENSNVVHDIIEKVQHMIRKYIIGLLIEMAIVSTVVCLVFWLLGIKYAILLGLLTGLFNIIPYIGIFSALVISSLVTFATATAVSKVIMVAATLVVTHLVDSNVLLPVVVGSKVRINALVTVLGVIIGEMIWGIPGMFLSIPVVAVLKIIFDRVDGLKPWGIILGDEDYKPSKLATKLETRKK
ncbi:AI-2E family transporter [Pedobacter sp. L105]|uniref:AI-2E family transporter n=1 Tax=Pedobacter sp. L105 TaxID=1641871 RepID=UPI00131E7D23|nr:AI-2E family transporter [Pedobacter sp. L105]